ncbi:MAG TPA: zf-HC2 domain-containing protein [Vicinamibacterales bacterium]|jgi:anti-sigma factor RsiW|nr:zf-HC2 domain-containing protein [Vicinamibacterales bacterium]
MPKCSYIDSLVTPYVDGELPPADRTAVDQHMDKCPPCRGRLLAERAIRGALAARRSVLCSEHAPAALRARCAKIGQEGRDGQDGRAALHAAAPVTWRSRLAPLSLAAALVLVVAGAFLYQLTAASSRVMAAELAADHMKCFAMNAVLGTHESAGLVESSMASGFDWRMQLPAATDAQGLDLVGSRPCLYGEGKVAHIMFRHNGTPVSLFMLPRTSRADELVRVLGHEAAIWSVGDRTFVLVARGTSAEVEHLAGFIQASLR